MKQNLFRPAGLLYNKESITHSCNTIFFLVHFIPGAGEETVNLEPSCMVAYQAETSNDVKSTTYNNFTGIQS